jgi:hypothetical protein
MKCSTKISIVGLLVLSVLPIVLAQHKEERNKKQLTHPPRGCEFNNLVLERGNREAGDDSILILIAIRGVNDTKLDVSRRRLLTARAYLTQYTNLREPANVIVAEALGDGQPPYGGVEIYVKGRLFDVLTSGPNLDLGLGACDSPESDDKESREKRALLYPWLYKKRKGF